MFGMNDPAQTLMQLESYIKDGRLEISEVMATQFTDMFLSQKKRNNESQLMLVKGLRILCDILIVRGKYALAVSSAKTLLRERKKLSKQSNLIGPLYIDLHRSAKALALAGKGKKARAVFIKIHKKSGGCLASSADAVSMIPNDKKMLAVFLTCVESSGPVIKKAERYFLEPQDLRSVDANQILQLIKSNEFVDKKCAIEQAERISTQIDAIEKGEMAANIKLQNALDSLKPKHDYYEYS